MWSNCTFFCIRNFFADNNLIFSGRFIEFPVLANVLGYM